MEVIDVSDCLKIRTYYLQPIFQAWPTRRCPMPRNWRGNSNSTAYRIVTQDRCPVLTVRERSSTDSERAALENMVAA